MKKQDITRCSVTRTPETKIPSPSVAITASPGLSVGRNYGLTLDQSNRFAAFNFQPTEIKTMITNTFKLTGMAVAIALAAGTLGTGQAHAYDIATIQTYDLGKQAGHADRIVNVAPIAAKPNGGAYIQWASATGWANGSRCTATSNVYVTEINNIGQVQGTDINLGISQPGGITAVGDNGFSYLLRHGDKSTLGVRNGATNNEVVLMNHRTLANCGWYDPIPETFVEGLNFMVFGWEIPFLPEHGDMAFGNNEISIALGKANNHRKPTDTKNNAHSGDAYITFNQTGGNARLSHAQSDHSDDRRIEHISGNTFVSVRINDRSGFRLYKHVDGVITDNDQLFTTKTDYTSQSGATVADLSYRHRYCSKQDQDANSPNCAWQDLFGIGGNGAGTSAGLLGDLHSVGDGSVTVTYGIKPANFVWNEFNQEEVTKNQLDFARINATGEVTLRRILFQPDGRVGTGNYTQYQPYERLTWVKSAMVSTGYIIFFRTETSDGAATNPRYTQGQVRMIEVDANGIITQGPSVIPASAGFNRADEVEVLANGTLAWTNTGDGSLKLSLLAPPDLTGGLPTAPPAPTAQAATNVSFNDFTASWNAINGASSYRIDVSTDNFQTFVAQDLAVT